MNIGAGVVFFHRTKYEGKRKTNGERDAKKSCMLTDGNVCSVGFFERGIDK